MKQIAPITRGTGLEAYLGYARETFGSSVTWQGKTFACVVETIPKREADALAEGMGFNSANASFRRLQLNPSDFPEGLYPPEMGEVNLTEGNTTRSYTILSVSSEMYAQAEIAVNLMIYRTPPAPSATLAPAGESDAGHRKTYWPQPAAS